MAEDSKLLKNIHLANDEVAKLIQFSTSRTANDLRNIYMATVTTAFMALFFDEYLPAAMENNIEVVFSSGGDLLAIVAKKKGGRWAVLYNKGHSEAERASAHEKRVVEYIERKSGISRAEAVIDEKIDLLMRTSAGRNALKLRARLRNLLRSAALKMSKRFSKTGSETPPHVAPLIIICIILVIIAFAAAIWRVSAVKPFKIAPRAH